MIYDVILIVALVSSTLFIIAAYVAIKAIMEDAYNNTTETNQTIYEKASSIPISELLTQSDKLSGASTLLKT